MVRVGIVGASGFTGAELLRLCAQHPDFEVVYATGDSQAGTRAADLYPSLAARYPALVFDELDIERASELDVVFLGLPHEASLALAPQLVDVAGCVVDLSAAFRLKDPALYPRWYGFAHDQPELLERPRVVVGTKSDSAVHDWEGARISAITNQGVRELVARMAAMVSEARAEQPETEGVVIIRPQPDGARVDRVADNQFRLVGRQVERIVALNDVSTPEALSYIDHQLKRLGVPRLLARAGAVDGDIIWIAGFSFDYREEV